jgi:hypothetical protein
MLNAASRAVTSLRRRWSSELMGSSKISADFDASKMGFRQKSR